MKNIFAIATKEIRSFFASPTAYIVIIAFLLPTYFLFWRSVLMTLEASLRTHFSLLPWFAIILIPALSMKSLAEEKSRQTLTLLLAHPVKEWQIILGKYLGLLGIYSIILLLNLSLPLSLSWVADLDWGQVLGQFLGGWFLGAAFLSLGVLASSLTSNTISSFITTALGLFVWILLGLDMIVLSLPYPANQIVRLLAVQPRVDQFSRGVMAMDDLTYFVTVIAVFLIAATIVIMSQKLAERPRLKQQLYFAGGLTLVIGVLLNYLAWQSPMRLDLTRDKLYTITPATRQTISQLPDIVNITFYTSRRLPPTKLPDYRYVLDTLKDYARYSDGKIKFKLVYPDEDEKAAQTAISQGVAQVNFQTFSSNRVASEIGYFGLVIEYGNQKSVIPFVSDPGNLEYDLTKRIRKLTADQPPSLAISSGLGERSRFADYTQLDKELTANYDIKEINLTDQETDLSQVSALFVVGPTQPLEATAEALLKNYLEQQNGKLMLLVDQYQPNYQLGIATKIDHGWDEFLKDYGVEINSDIVYDLQFNQLITVGNGVLAYPVNYPFWIRAFANPQFPPVAGMDGVTLAWPSSITLDQSDPVNTMLLSTSTNAGALTDTFTIAPDNLPKQSDGQNRILGIARQTEKYKLVVITDSDLISDSFVQNDPRAITLVTNLLDWLVVPQDQQVLKRKNFNPPLMRLQPGQGNLLQIVNLVVLPLAVALAGFVYLKRRQRLTHRKLNLK